MISSSQMYYRGMYFIKKNQIYIIAAFVLLVIFMAISTSKESFTDFSGMWDELASYPQVFVENLTAPFTGNVDRVGMYRSAKFVAVPNVPDIPQMNISNQQVTVPIDIGSGLSIQAKVQVPAQVTSVQAQDTVKITEPTPTDVKVAAQTVQIPEQTGMMTSVVSKTGDTIQVPITVPAQVVNIEEQVASTGVKETFRM